MYTQWIPRIRCIQRIRCLQRKNPLDSTDLTLPSLPKLKGPPHFKTERLNFVFRVAMDIFPDSIRGIHRIICVNASIRFTNPRNLTDALLKENFLFMKFI